MVLFSSCGSVDVDKVVMVKKMVVVKLEMLVVIVIIVVVFFKYGSDYGSWGGDIVGFSVLC